MIIDDERAAELVRLTAGGDHAAFGELWHMFSRLVFTEANRVLGNPHDAEDTSQEVAVNLWRWAGRYDPSKGPVRNWVGIMARSKALDRGKQRGRRASVLDNYRALPEESSQPARPDAEAMAAEDKARVIAAVDRLPRKLRDAVMEMMVKGQRRKAYGRARGVTESAAASRLRHGMALLRKHWK